MNIAAPLVPPPGAGLTTVTLAVVAELTTLAGIETLSWVLLTKLVEYGIPFRRTDEVGTKLEPPTVNVNAPLPTRTETGLRPLIVGTGLLIVNVAELDGT